MIIGAAHLYFSPISPCLNASTNINAKYLSYIAIQRPATYSLKLGVVGLRTWRSAAISRFFGNGRCIHAVIKLDLKLDLIYRFHKLAIGE